MVVDRRADATSRLWYRNASPVGCWNEWEEWQNYLTQNLNTERHAPCAAVPAHSTRAAQSATAAAGVRRNHDECAFLPVNLLAFSDPSTAAGTVLSARVPGSFAYGCSSRDEVSSRCRDHRLALPISQRGGWDLWNLHPPLKLHSLKKMRS